MSEESKQQKQQDQYTQAEDNHKDQKQNTGFGDKKLDGPDRPST